MYMCGHQTSTLSLSIFLKQGLSPGLGLADFIDCWLASHGNAPVSASSALGVQFQTSVFVSVLGLELMPSGLHRKQFILEVIFPTLSPVF